MIKDEDKVIYITENFYDFLKKNRPIHTNEEIKTILGIPIEILSFIPGKEWQEQLRKTEKENDSLKDFLDYTILKLTEIKTLFVGHQSSNLTENEKDFVGEQIEKKLNVLKNHLIYELKEMEK